MREGDFDLAREGDFEVDLFVVVEVEEAVFVLDGDLDLDVDLAFVGFSSEDWVVVVVVCLSS